MMKMKYHITTFPPETIKWHITALIRLIIGMSDDFFEMFKMYADESYGQSPRELLHNLIRNNESIFGSSEFDTIPCASTSSKVQSKQESSSRVKGESSSAPSLDKTKDDLGPVKLGTETATADIQESVAIPPKPELSTEGDKMDISPAKDVKTEINPKEGRKSSDKSEDEKVVTRKENAAQIKSMTIIRGYDTVLGVEIDINLPSKSHESSPNKPEQDPGTSEKTGKKSKSPSSSPSKPSQSTAGLSIPRKSRLTVDYTDSKILEFLTGRLLLISSWRKSYMAQIHVYFQNFSKDVLRFSDIVNKINFVIQYFPVRLDAGDDLIVMRHTLRKIGVRMSEKAQTLLNDIEKDIDVTEKCLKEIELFEKQRLPVSKEGESILTIDEIKTFESDLKEICKEVDESVIRRDGGRTVFLNLSPDFDWLYRHYVKFLILTRVLRLVSVSS